MAVIFDLGYPVGDGGADTGKPMFGFIQDNIVLFPHLSGYVESLPQSPVVAYVS